MAFDPSQAFRLHTVKLAYANFCIANDSEAVSLDDGRTTVQARRWVVPSLKQEKVDDDDEAVLRVLVHLGLRKVTIQSRESVGAEDGSNGSRKQTSNSKDDVLVHYEIEAHFAVEFVINNTPDTQEDFERFIEVNAVHIAWPFWREHVFSTLRAASLPLAEVPLLAPARAQKKSADQLEK